MAQVSVALLGLEYLAWFCLISLERKRITLKNKLKAGFCKAATLLIGNSLQI
jgi:hypothetical protein